MLALTSYTASALAFAPGSVLAPTVSSVRRSGPPVLNLQRRVESAALGAALAATLSVNAATAADPWPYSTLISKVQADDVAKVRKSASPNISPASLAQPCMGYMFLSASGSWEGAIPPSAVESPLRPARSSLAVPLSPPVGGVPRSLHRTPSRHLRAPSPNAPRPLLPSCYLDSRWLSATMAPRSSLSTRRAATTKSTSSRAATPSS